MRLRLVRSTYGDRDGSTRGADDKCGGSEREVDCASGPISVYVGGRVSSDCTGHVGGDCFLCCCRDCFGQHKRSNGEAHWLPSCTLVVVTNICLVAVRVKLKLGPGHEKLDGVADSLPVVMLEDAFTIEVAERVGEIDVKFTVIEVLLLESDVAVEFFFVVATSRVVVSFEVFVVAAARVVTLHLVVDSLFDEDTDWVVTFLYLPAASTLASNRAGMRLEKRMVQT